MSLEKSLRLFSHLPASPGKQPQKQLKLLEGPKIPLRKDVPVRLRPQERNKLRVCMRFFVQALGFCTAKF